MMCWAQTFDQDFQNWFLSFTDVPKLGFVRLGALTLILTRAGLAMDLNALQRLRFVVPWATKTDFEWGTYRQVSGWSNHSEKHKSDRLLPVSRFGLHRWENSAKKTSGFIKRLTAGGPHKCRCARMVPVLVANCSIVVYWSWVVAT